MNPRGSQSPESLVRDIRRNTRRKYSTEEKISIVTGVKTQEWLPLLDYSRTFGPVVQFLRRAS